MPIEKWRTNRSELVLDNRWAKVRKDVCELPGGQVIDDYYYWEGSDFAQIFALTEDNRVPLVRQYKHGVREVTLELPAGLLSPPEAPIDCARRELLEETGYAATDWQALGTLNVSSAKASTKAHLFLALGASLVAKQRLDATEDIEIMVLSIRDVLELLANGEIRDTSSLATTLLALQHLGYLSLNR